MRTQAIAVPRPPAILSLLLLATFFLSLLMAMSAHAQTQQEVMQALLVGQRQQTALLERLAQANPVPAPASTSAPAATDPAVTGNCTQPDKADRALCIAAYAVEIGQQNSARYNELAPRVEASERSIAALKRNSHAPATASATPAHKPTTSGATGSVVSANSAGPAPDLRAVAASPEFRRRAIRFVGLVPNEADVKAVKALVDGGRYELASTTSVTWLPAPGNTDQERNLAHSGRDANLDKAYGAGLGGRSPADPEELAELQRSAPAGTGAIVHLKKK